MTLNAVSAQGMTKKHRPRVQHRPFALSCPASHPAPDTGRRQGDSGVLFTVCNMRWWRKCEAGRLRYDKSSSNRLVELMTYRSVIFWHCYSTLCIPTYTVIRWMKTIVKDEDSVHWPTLLIVKTQTFGYQSAFYYCFTTEVQRVKIHGYTQKSEKKISYFSTLQCLCTDRVCKGGRLHIQPQTWEKGNGQTQNNRTYSALSPTSKSVRVHHTLKKHQWGEVKAVQLLCCYRSSQSQTLLEKGC